MRSPRLAPLSSIWQTKLAGSPQAGTKTGAPPCRCLVRRYVAVAPGYRSVFDQGGMGRSGVVDDPIREDFGVVRTAHPQRQRGEQRIQDRLVVQPLLHRVAASKRRDLSDTAHARPSFSDLSFDEG